MVHAVVASIKSLQKTKLMPLPIVYTLSEIKFGGKINMYTDTNYPIPTPPPWTSTFITVMLE